MSAASAQQQAPARPDTAAPLHVVVVNGSPNEPSKTMGLVEVILATLNGLVAIDSSRVDVYRLGQGFIAAVERDDVTPDVEAALQRVEHAELLVAAVPVFRGSYPGMFKHFFDLVDQYALANKPVLLAATAGSERHTLVLEHAMRPLFGFFQALTVPVAFFAAGGDFDGTTLLNPRVYGRIETGLADVADLLKARSNQTVAAASDGASPAAMPADVHPRETGT